MQAEKESAEATFTVAQKQLESARAQLTVTEKQAQAAAQQQTASAAQTDATAQNITIAEATVKQRQADLDFAKLQLSYTVITSPSNGKVSRKSVQAGQQIGQGQNLFSVVADNDIWVVANFKETQLTRVHEGQTVELVADAFKDTPLKGKIQSIQDATGARFALLPPDNASGNFVKVVQRIPVKIVLNEVPKIGIKAGMNVHTTIDLD
jgi:membrane fusion protein, multidrug efflux system